ncbi:murein biosynthesis integral membrane protein MurJ [Svornostia abyssi]|uniref:Probable lipid II flippase MurJ n=1 Tax=Svornostia abyssi TaxID=2898438 RepID=A0ABY5PE42_9ACTN|nr:murein biosynthesis integral membrane protein MurJ [Parviterribacteraceae bacterium J379]
MADRSRPPRAGQGRIARNTAIFSIATGLSRIAGMGREVVASSYFGTSGAFSAFTIAFQVPTLVRNLFADSALSAAFVPVFTELLEKDKRKDAFMLATTFLAIIVGALGLLSVGFFFAAPYVMPLFTGKEFTEELDQLTIGLSQVLFPIVLLLGVNGLLVGILMAYDHFTIPAISPLVWNVVIIVTLVATQPLFEGDDQLYAYAIGILLGTAVQLAMAIPVLRRLDFQWARHINVRDPRVGRVLILMLPVTLGLGLINFNQLISSLLASEVSEEAPRAIDAAFRIYMLPQGMFSVAIATVLFPTLSRLAARRDYDDLRGLMGTGMRQIILLLVPSAVACLVLAEPITRLVYQRGEFDADSTELVSQALFWFQFSLPFAGVNLLLTRTFFSLQKPWTPTALAVGSLTINVGLALLLYEPYGVPGIVVATAAASAAMSFAQSWALRGQLGGRLEGGQTFLATLKVLLASAALGAVTYAVWWGLNDLLGVSLPAQIVSVGLGLTAGAVTYLILVRILQIPEWVTIEKALRARIFRST